MLDAKSGKRFHWLPPSGGKRNLPARHTKTLNQPRTGCFSFLSNRTDSSKVMRSTAPFPLVPNKRTRTGCFPFRSTQQTFPRPYGVLLRLSAVVFTHADLRVPLGSLVSWCSWGTFSLGYQPGSSESAPLCHLVGFRVAALLYCPPLPEDGLPLTHSHRREVASGPATRQGAHPTASGRVSTVALFEQSHPAVQKRWRCFRSRTLRPFEVTLLQRG